MYNLFLQIMWPKLLNVLTMTAFYKCNFFIKLDIVLAVLKNFHRLDLPVSDCYFKLTLI